MFYTVVQRDFLRGDENKDGYIKIYLFCT